MRVVQALLNFVGLLFSLRNHLILVCQLESCTKVAYLLPPLHQIQQPCGPTDPARHETSVQVSIGLITPVSSSRSYQVSSCFKTHQYPQLNQIAEVCPDATNVQIWTWVEEIASTLCNGPGGLKLLAPTLLFIMIAL